MPAFYRTYRPGTFAEIVGQEHVVRALGNAIKRDRIGHAYLITGPRGTGKTTLARLLAKAANCTDRKGTEPCGKCANCVAMREGRSLDLIEIDAATHTQVDKMRELLEGVPVPPALGRYKTYIIDEAHMLSNASWNAFLKTLEEPPAHAIFVLATTAAEKIPETIVSRCQRFELSKFPLEKIVGKLTKIAKKEKIDIEEGALRIIAIAAEGGMRDAESLFSQVASLQESPITESDAAALLGVTETAKLEALAERLSERDLKGAVMYVRELSGKGENFSAFLPSFLRYLRTVLLLSMDAEVAEDDLAAFTGERRDAIRKIAGTFAPDEVIPIIEHFQEAENRLRISSVPELAVEIAVAKSAPAPEETKVPKRRVEEEEEEEEATEDVPSEHGEDETGRPDDDADPGEPDPNDGGNGREEPEKGGAFSFIDIQDRWHDILREATRINASLTLALSNARPKSAEGNRVTIAVRFPFHRDRLVDPANALTLAQAFDTILSAKTKLAVVVEPAETGTDPLISHALSALGGEVI